MIVLCGKSGSGKDTIGKELLNMGLRKVVTYTTRPPRKNEIDGENYHFISDGKFLLMKSRGDFLETTQYEVADGSIWYYGTPKEELDDNKFVILNPDGVREILKHPEYNPIVFYLFTKDKKRMERLRERGDNPIEVSRRMYADEVDFAGMGELADYHIPNNVSEPKIIADYIWYIYFEKGRK